MSDYCQLSFCKSRFTRCFWLCHDLRWPQGSKKVLWYCLQSHSSAFTCWELEPLQPMKWQHLVSQARGHIGKLGHLFFTLLGDEHSINNNMKDFANILCKIFFSNRQFKLSKYWWGQLCLSQTLVVTSPYGPYANIRPCTRQLWPALEAKMQALRCRSRAALHVQ